MFYIIIKFKLTTLLYIVARAPSVKKGVISELSFSINRTQQPCLLNQNFRKESIKPVVHIDENVSQYLNCSDVKISESCMLTFILCLWRNFYNNRIWNCMFSFSRIIVLANFESFVGDKFINSKILSYSVKLEVYLFIYLYLDMWYQTYYIQNIWIGRCQTNLKFWLTSTWDLGTQIIVWSFIWKHNLLLSEYVLKT